MKNLKLRNSSQEGEKVLQLILSLKIPAHSVIACINTLIEKNDWKQSRSYGTITMDVEQREIAERESSLCQFVYAYLLQNHQLVKKQGGEGSEDFNQGKIDLYEQTTEFVQKFKWTRHPITTYWLIEIIHILSNKFVAPAALDQTDIQDKLEKQLTFLLENAACIINNEAKLDFNTHEYCLFDLHLSPTVYEILKRFQFMLQKNEDICELEQAKEFEDRSTQSMVEHQLMLRYEEGTGEEDPAKASNRNQDLLFSRA